MLVEEKQRWKWRFIGWWLRWSILNLPGVEGKGSSSKEGILGIWVCFCFIWLGEREIGE